MGSYYLVNFCEGISVYIKELEEKLSETGLDCSFFAPRYSFYDRKIYLRSFIDFQKHLSRATAKFNTAHLHYPIIPSVIPFIRLISRFKNSFVQIWNPPNDTEEFDIWHTIFNSTKTSSLVLKALNSTIISPTKYLKNTLELLGAKKVCYIPAGINTQKYSICDPKPLGKNDKQSINILYYGHLTKWKGVHNLIKALAIVKKENTNFKLTIFWTGYGKHYIPLKNMIRQLELENQIRIKREIVKNIPLLLNSFDIGVLPLISAVGTASPPRVLLEMMSCGLPVVATNVGGVTEIVEHKKTGILTNSNPNEMANGIITLFDESYRYKIRNNARRTIENKHDWNQIVYKYQKLYEAASN
jgi:glycosyltransferase involved in cell wall biosynthesis